MWWVQGALSTDGKRLCLHRRRGLKLASGYSGHRAYSLSKLCDAMLSQELHQRYGDPPLLCFNTMDPTSQCGSGCDTKSA